MKTNGTTIVQPWTYNPLQWQISNSKAQTLLEFFFNLYSGNLIKANLKPLANSQSAFKISISVYALFENNGTKLHQTQVLISIMLGRT